MRRALVVGALVVAACGGDAERAKARAYRDAVCACHDVACVERVDREHADLLRAMQQKYRGDIRPDDELRGIGAEAVKCHADATGDDELQTARQYRFDMCDCPHDADPLGCTDRVRRRYTDWNQRIFEKAASDRGFDWHIVDNTSAAERCYADVRAAAAPAAAAAGAASSATGIPECDEYVARVETLVACPRMPKAARDGAQQGLAAMRQAWSFYRDPSTPASARKAAADACRQAADAMQQTGRAIGCP